MRCIGRASTVAAMFAAIIGCHKAEMVSGPSHEEAPITDAQCHVVPLLAVEPHDSPNMASPSSTILIAHGGITHVALEERVKGGDWNPRDYPIPEGESPTSVWAKGVQLNFDREYRIRGFVGGCPTEWFGFKIGPPNVDGSGSQPREDEPSWGPTVCVRKDFTPGVSATLGVYATSWLKITTYDFDHTELYKKGLQNGQIETMRVAGVGLTWDIPDAKNEQMSVFPLERPIGIAEVTSESGSIDMVCASGR